MNTPLGILLVILVVATLLFYAFYPRKKKESPTGNAELDKFHDYLIKYLAQNPMPPEVLRNDKTALNHIALVRDKMKWGFMIQNGSRESFMDDAPKFCKAVLKTLRAQGS